MKNGGKIGRLASLEIHKDEFSFSAGHFTIFSATERESLHGHNYQVSVAFELNIENNGMSFDYRYYKNKIQQICDQLDRRFMLPSHSPYMRLEENDQYWVAHFNQQALSFPKEDVVILELANTTIEELSHWFLQQLLLDEPQIRSHGISSVELRVYNGPGQSGGALWQR